MLLFLLLPMPSFSSFIPFLFFSSLLFHSSFSTDDQEALALLSWKNSLTSPLNSLVSWNPLHPNPCKWFGITCNQHYQVISITLKSIDIQGSLPSSLHSLTSLQSLTISSTNISGAIPKAFGGYLQLTFLDLSKNQLSGEIPVELCKLTKLDFLSLNSNSLQGAIPYDIGSLLSLKSLTLYDNYLSGQIPASIGYLNKLEVFRAGGNQNLKGMLPLEIGNCTNLVMLGLAETSISGNLPYTIGRLKKIQTIAIYTAMLSGPFPQEIGNCTELTGLFLYQNSISGSIPAEIGNLKKLETLLLWQNSLVGSIPYEIGNCQQLSLMDLSLNLISGSIPNSIGKLSKLQQLQLSTNQLSGSIPAEISNCSELVDFEVDNNELSGEIGVDFKKLKGLKLFYAWQNKLTGNVPVGLAECENLQSIDLSYNNLTGSIPKQLFGLQNLTKLLLLSNEFSGFIPLEVGNCTNLFRLRLNKNNIAGTIPAEIGNLKNLNFLDVSNNRLVGCIPQAISKCQNLEFLDLHSNSLSGSLPGFFPKKLQFVDVSDNSLSGTLSGSTIGSLVELTKFVAGKNRFSGSIPSEIKLCTKLQLLDLGGNFLSGEIPNEIGHLPALEISLNLSCNSFFGSVQNKLEGLTKLGVLDISHNYLTGSVNSLSNLQNLVLLNISFNSFSGELPDTPFFQKLPLSDLTGNHGLFISSRRSMDSKGSSTSTLSALKLAMSILISLGAVLLLVAAYANVHARMSAGAESSETWDVTLYQKLDFSVDDVARLLTSANVIGTGSSGVVYKVSLQSGETLAVKKMWSAHEVGAFQNEIATLGTIRHRNIVRLLGWAVNGSSKLLFYNYLVNGSLSSFLHRGVKGSRDWEVRYGIVAGVAHAIAYLHHDCVPAILHGDVKSMNVLLGPCFEAYLADFGLAKVLTAHCGGSSQEIKALPKIAGSYGYFAPEHASMQKITEKSDVYSYGVVLMEVLTGRHPLDPSLPGGAHLVQWIREHLANKRDPMDLVDLKLHGQTEPERQEIVHALSIALLCVSDRPEDRPMMKDVVALLKEIRRVENEEKKTTTNSSYVASPIRALDSQGTSTRSFAFSDSSSL